MIVTVTPNPAVDQALMLRQLTLGDTNRVLDSRIAAAYLTPGTQLCYREAVERLLSEVRVKRLPREPSSPARRRAAGPSRRR